MTTHPPPPLIKPSDARSWSLCARRVWLDNKGDFEPATTEDAFQEVIIQLGLEHEEAVLRQLASTRKVHTATSPEDTERLMTEGVPVIYQAQLVDRENGFTGYPDFLIRHASGEYQAADAKLSLDEEKTEIQVQLGFYRRMLGSTLPAIVFQGDGNKALIGDEADLITNQFVSEMRELLAENEEPRVRYSHSKCKVCPYYTHCKSGFELREDLSLLYGIQGRAALALEAAGISTISQLAAADPDVMPDVPYLKGSEKKQRAILQARSYKTGEVFQRKPIVLPEGQWVHFDIEDNPLTGNGVKHVYLWGFLVPDSPAKNASQDNFEYVWTDHHAEDEFGWQQFLARIEEYRQRYPCLILAHYASHERTTIRSYAERYGMQNNATVAYLLGEGGPLFDIQKPVLNSLVLPLQGYGLKDVCKHRELVNFQWQDDDSGAQWSIVQFNRFLQESDPQAKEKLKQEILGYNRDDVRATQRLEAWLRSSFWDS